MITPDGTKHYFVDEAGDTTLFNARGRCIVGQEGVSSVFVLGVADIPDPGTAKDKLDRLRQELLADPYFKGVPSMQLGAGKTAEAFHAKDDLPEVRREVFRLLATFETKVQAAFRRKTVLASAARVLQQQTGQKLHAASIYDDLTKRLFKNLLHRGAMHEVCFARRGKSDRQEALEAALARAQRNFAIATGCEPLSSRPYRIRSSVPSQDVGLQVIDYYMWALQRLIERGEDRYFGLVADRFSLVMDLDDKSTKPYGTWYTVRNPLTLEKLKPLGN